METLKAGQVSRTRAAQEYVETVAHELRTPLHTATGFLAFLLQGMAGPVTAMQRDMLVSLGTSLEQAQSLVEDLLCLSQLENGQFKIALEQVDLQKVVKENMASLSVMAEAAGATLVGPEPVPASPSTARQLVMAAPNRLGQCLRNLLSNAIKFSPAGSVVKVSVAEEAQNYVVRVTDQGPGIPPAYLVAVFERHFQATNLNATQPHPDGYGLGLSITRQLIECQGGRIGVESIYGKGSCFWFSLPKAAV